MYKSFKTAIVAVMAMLSMAVSAEVHKSNEPDRGYISFNNGETQLVDMLVDMTLSCPKFKPNVWSDKVHEAASQVLDGYSAAGITTDAALFSTVGDKANMYENVMPMMQISSVYLLFTTRGYTMPGRPTLRHIDDITENGIRVITIGTAAEGAAQSLLIAAGQTFLWKSIADSKVAYAMLHQGEADVVVANVPDPGRHLLEASKVNGVSTPGIIRSLSLNKAHPRNAEKEKRISSLFEIFPFNSGYLKPTDGHTAFVNNLVLYVKKTEYTKIINKQAFDPRIRELVSCYTNSLPAIRTRNAETALSWSTAQPAKNIRYLGELPKVKSIKEDPVAAESGGVTL